MPIIKDATYYRERRELIKREKLEALKGMREAPQPKEIKPREAIKDDKRCVICWSGWTIPSDYHVVYHPHRSKWLCTIHGDMVQPDFRNASTNKRL